MARKNTLDLDTVLQIEEELLSNIIAISIYSGSKPYHIAFLMQELFGLRFTIQSQVLVDNQYVDSTPKAVSNQSIAPPQQTVLLVEESSSLPTQTEGTINVYKCAELGVQMQHALHNKLFLKNYVNLHADYCWTIKGQSRNVDEYTNTILHKLRQSAHISFAALAQGQELKNIALLL